MSRRSISCADTAKLVRAQLKKTFPTIKFSVRSHVYSGGASIDVSWLDGPTTKNVEGVAKQFAGGRFDGMIDMAYSVEHYLLPDGSAMLAHSPGSQGSMGIDAAFDNPVAPVGSECVRFCADYVFCTRRHSAAMMRAALDKVAERFGVDVSSVEIVDGPDAYIKNPWALRVGDHDVQTMVHRELHNVG